MLTFAFAALSLLASGPLEILVASGYREAFDRAQRYEQDAESDFYRKRSFQPAVEPSMRRLLQTCAAVGGQSDLVFTLVLAFDPDIGAPAILMERDTPRARCVAEGLAKLTYPDPPHPDFAEEIRFDFN